jgi:hypothetical protein
LKRILIVTALIVASGCGARMDLSSAKAAPACSRVCTDRDLELQGGLVVADGADDQCICEVKTASTAPVGSGALAGR